MSGGHFDYEQYKIGYIADEVEQLILSNKDDSLNEYGYTKGRFFADDVINEFKKGLHHLRMAHIYAQRIDWLVSGDDGEEAFFERLEKEIKNVEVPEENEKLKDMLSFCLSHGNVKLCNDCGWIKRKGCVCNNCGE
jgi:hypothetical protein